MDTGNLKVAPPKGGEVQDGAVKRQNSENQHIASRRGKEDTLVH